MRNLIFCLFFIYSLCPTSYVFGSDIIRIVGSSTVYPFTTVVAERFSRETQYKTPVVESTGTGGGLKLFCASKEEKSPDFTNASRRIKDSELAQCQKNGISVTEFVIGIDGIVVANSNETPILKITIPQLYLALAQTVPVAGQLVKNPYQKWSEIEPSLPNRKIEILGPPPSSGTRDALVSLVMKVGAKHFGIKDKKLYKLLRDDGAFVEAGENDNLIVRKLILNPNAFGIFGYSFLEENLDSINAAWINGVAPDYETISNFEYPIARYLYVYIKREKVAQTQGMREFIKKYASEEAIGEEGYLTERGLIALPEEELQEVLNNVHHLKKLK